MIPAHPIYIGRVYDSGAAVPAARLLVDRLWPRGKSKAALQLDDWPRDLTPSTALRQWYHADPEARRAEFRLRYRAELAAHPDAVASCLAWCRKGPVLLLTAAQRPELSHAEVLREVLIEQLALNPQ